MPNVTSPTDTEKQIMRENGLSNDKDYGVMYRDAECIRLLNFLTRDILTIHKGDRKW